MARGITGGVAPPLEEIDKLLEDGGDVAYELRDAKGQRFLHLCHLSFFRICILVKLASLMSPISSPPQNLFIAPSGAVCVMNKSPQLLYCLVLINILSVAFMQLISWLGDIASIPLLYV
jgi:hypothetical protein